MTPRIRNYAKIFAVSALFLLSACSAQESADSTESSASSEISAQITISDETTESSEAEVTETVSESSAEETTTAETAKETIETTTTTATSAETTASSKTSAEETTAATTVVTTTATTTAATTASTSETTAADPTIYEAENALMMGTVKAIDDESASGGKLAGNFSDGMDTINFVIDIPKDGVYEFTFRSKGIGGDKINFVFADDTKVGELSSKSEKLSDYTINGVALTKGTHTISVTCSWGWIQMDYLKVIQGKGISDEVYNVDASLINPNATQNTKSLFKYLCDSYGKTTLAGQVCDNGLNGPEFMAIHKVTGKYPAVLGLDMMDYTPSRTALGAKSVAVESAKLFYQEGGIVSFCWHWNAPTEYLKPDKAGQNPNWWGGFYTDNSTFDLGKVMDGTDKNGKELLDKDIAEIAKQLKRLEEAGVPVLWRPLHEASGGWFWWGASGADAYKKFWIYLYDELTNTYECNNLIWVWNGQNADWYPGDKYVDIIGEDIYADAQHYEPHTAKFTELLGYSKENKIIALTENGVIFDIDKAIAANTRWSWFNTWCGDFAVKNNMYSEEYTEKEILRKAYDSEYIITLDELPDLYK